MFVPRPIEREILLALYRYSLLTTEQLSVLLHYEQPTLYAAFRTLRQKGWTESLSLDFLPRNVKGWVLTKGGMEVAFGLTKEYRTRLLRESSLFAGQTEHLYGSNQFFINLIRTSRALEATEGLIDWIGMRDAGERYSITDRNGKRSTPLRPDGIGIYRFRDESEVIFHVEYDTGSEHLWVLHNKLWQYADVLKSFWADISLASVLFITRDARRSERIRTLWRDMCKDAFLRQPIPAVWTATESSLASGHLFDLAWQGINDEPISFLQFPRFPGGHADRSIPFGKQVRIQPTFGKTHSDGDGKEGDA
ncbi:replication-relaxation family protein [Ferroacidibacillus organovorans]|uniref:Replication-relaxation n=1 Tax=Ferroacidibacillus organovorans TaxID=1765683 RepID=A0A1V4EVV8_9BACL|nr:replication-relaxation family protein [Ferroacidibacillus organovorans]OPG16980.1 hypothetical protein B2M26_03995 [Ferroacidibacillus organovorans]